MITVRIDPKTEAMVERIARRTGQTKSQIVREALKLLVERESVPDSAADRYQRVAHLIGSWSSGGMNLSENTGKKFAELLRKKAGARRSR
jgi:hypothetical protein